MRLRARPDLWATSLFLALGLLPITACGGSSDDDRQNQFPCAASPAGQANGYAVCENGVTIRESVVECPSSLPRAEAQSSDPTLGDCTYDADCIAMPNGYCSTNVNIGGDSAGAYCYYGCTADADCAADQICVCGDPVGHCAQAKCKSDADCGSDFHCASYDSSGGCDFQSFACQKPNDECAVNADCATGLLCALDEATQARVCKTGGCAIGRPFLVDEVARVAPTARRGDWLAGGLAPDLERLSPELRERLVQEWTRAGQLEHASVAAFSRFLLELLAFGAPSELVAQTISALEDERQHAQICFTLASEFAGEAIGPGPLDVEGALESPTLARSLATALREGCIGETVAALEASELAAHAVDPLLAQVLERIAADERRHSELAWKFAQWAVSQEPALAEVLENELLLVQDEIENYGPLTSGPRAFELARAGVMPAALRAAVRDAGLRQIVEPALSGTIAHARSQSKVAA